MKRICLICALMCLLACSAGNAEDIIKASRPFAKGDAARLADVMRRAEAGERIVLGVIGGSITEGYSATRRENSYAELVLKWWQEKFPQADISLVNAGIGGTSSYLGVHRVDDDLLKHEPDFVIVEFSVNDGNDYFHQKSYDNLVRRILLHEKLPACLLLFMSTENGSTAQQVHSNIGFRYKLQMISYVNAVEHEVDSGAFAWSDISPDGVHPNDHGHAFCAELITAYLDEVYANIESIKAPKPFKEPPATVETYMNSRLIKAEALDANGYSLKRVAGAYPVGLVGTGEYGFELEFSSLGILYLKTPGASGEYDVIIDGERVMSLDSGFTNGWGASADAKQVYTSKECALHNVTIAPKSASEGAFTLLGLLVSR